MCWWPWRDLGNCQYCSSRLIAGIYDAFADGQWSAAAAGHHRLQKLCSAMFLETNPVPVKTSLALMGKLKEEIRLPLTLMETETRRQLQQVLKEYELI